MSRTRPLTAESVPQAWTRALPKGQQTKTAIVDTALRMAAQEPGIGAVFVNIFAGLARCDAIAQDIIDTLHAMPVPDRPIVVRLSGTNEEIAREMLQAEPLVASAGSMSEGAGKAVELAGRA